MGLVTKRNEQLKKLFDQLATDPKQAVKKPEAKDQPQASKSSDQNK